MASLTELMARMKGNDKGAGDTIKRVTAAVGVKPCGGCQKRAEALNKRFPYKKG